MEVFLDEKISYKNFYLNYLVNNQFCVFGKWITNDWFACQSWRDSNDDVNINKLFECVPTDSTLCVANCSKIEFDSHPTEQLNVKEFLSYWNNKTQNQQEHLLYLKDWHYFKYPSKNKFYNIPKYFSSDWLNEFWSIRHDVNDDFKFVYLGCKNTWTPLHSDVYRSFSWSANISGHKRWWFFPPGEEQKLKSHFGSIPFDIRHVNLDEIDIKYHIIDQFPGQIVFVPSGWYHEVLNMTDCLSINHNWFNATNVKEVWNHLLDQLNLVEKSTEDVRSIPGWHEECQICLRALSGIDFKEFFVLLKYIIVTRWPNSKIDIISKYKYVGEENNLDSINNLIDQEFDNLFKQNSEIFYKVLKNPQLWTEWLSKSQVNDDDDNNNNEREWIRIHDYCSSIEVLKYFIQHPVVKILRLVDNSLNLEKKMLI